MPKVGIALATYMPNLEFLRIQIESIRSQSFADWVCLISDDSSDASVAKEIQDLCSLDSRFLYIRNEPSLKGVSGNFENALNHLGPDFDYYAFCDQDDVWEKSKLERSIRAMQQNPTSLLVHCDLSLIDESGNLLNQSCWKVEQRNLDSEIDMLDLAARNNVTGCAAFFRRELRNMALPFPATAKTDFLHDHWIAVLARSLGPIAVVSAPLIQYRQHSQNVVGASLPSRMSVSKIFSNIFHLRPKLESVFFKRQSLAKALVNRLEERATMNAPLVRSQLMPLIQPSQSKIWKKIFETENSVEKILWIKILLGSFLSAL